MCQICGKPNHNVTVCWNRYDCIDKDIPKALTTINLNNNVDQNFYEYLGATSHMTDNIGKLNQIRSCKGHDKIFKVMVKGIHW